MRGCRGSCKPAGAAVPTLPGTHYRQHPASLPGSSCCRATCQHRGAVHLLLTLGLPCPRGSSRKADWPPPGGTTLPWLGIPSAAAPALPPDNPPPRGLTVPQQLGPPLLPEACWLTCSVILEKPGPCSPPSPTLRPPQQSLAHPSGTNGTKHLCSCAESTNTRNSAGAHEETRVARLRSAWMWGMLTR